jgi:hypothetical protein
LQPVPLANDLPSRKTLLNYLTRYSIPFCITGLFTSFSAFPLCPRSSNSKAAATCRSPHQNHVACIQFKSTIISDRLRFHFRTRVGTFEHHQIASLSDFLQSSVILCCTLLANLQLISQSNQGFRSIRAGDLRGSTFISQPPPSAFAMSSLWRRTISPPPCPHWGNSAHIASTLISPKLWSPAFMIPTSWIPASPLSTLSARRSFRVGKLRLWHLPALPIFLGDFPEKFT